MSEGAFVGIDLGTTYSLVAVVEGGVPRVLPNRIGEVLTPSAVSVTEDGTVLVGAAARARATTHPSRTAMWFKRDMGTDRTYDLGGMKLRPEELSALVLAELRRDAEAALGREVDEAVVTVPAYFGELQRRATRDACEIAGLHVERIINEPTAAALAYGLQHRDRELRAIVLDLGGGTFDVTVLEIMEGVIEIQASSGDARLGGEDFVDCLTRRLRERIAREHDLDVCDATASHARLREAAEQAKRVLSSADTARIALPELRDAKGKQRSVELSVGLSEAEESWKPVLERLELPVVRALRDASAAPGDIDEVILVGGATRMPCVVRLASKLLQRLPLRTLPVDEAVALGAAVQAALKAGNADVEDVVATDVAPFTLGTSVGERVGDTRVEGIYSPIIERGTPLPASRVKTYFVSRDGQTSCAIDVYQGEHARCEHNQLLGNYVVKGIPPDLAGKQQIAVRFTYDLNGLLEVDTTVVSTGVTNTLLIERSPGLLGPDEIARARAAFKRLKLHPRDALPNTAALGRAEAMYVELTGEERARLGECIADFRAALESQDAEMIERRREILKRRCASLIRGQ
ncbi:MAG: Hsp70 family protein [Myxococcales bacterium]|nr:Hsp70 family protein [Myxococcales bacterium]